MPDLPNPATSSVTSPAASGMGGTPPQAPSDNAQAPPPADMSLMGGPGTAPTVPGATYPHPISSAVHGWNALVGSHQEVNMTGNGPQAYQAPNKPGQLFRSILAGAIMGAAAGTEPHQGGGWGAAALGAKAAQQGQQQQNQQQLAQAQQQWQNQLAAKKEQREQTGFDTEQQVRKAQLAQANAETLRANIMTQGSSFDLHQKIADADKDRISTFANAGVKPLYEDITESQMNDIIKNSPGATSLDWRHTGVKTVLDKDGNPNYEYTLSAYDPKASAPLSPATVKQWDEDGLFKYHPEYKDIAKPGKVLSVDQFTALDKQSQNYANQTLARTKNDLEVEKDKAQIDEAKAAVKAHNAAAFSETLNAQEKQKEISRRNEEDKAWDALSKAGNDPDKVTDAHMRTVLARSVQPLMQETLGAIKTAAAENDTAEQASLWGKYNAYQKLASLAPPGPLGSDPAVAAAISRLKGLPQAQIESALANPAITATQKEAIRSGLGIAAPAPAKPIASPSALGKAVLGAAQTAGSAYQNVSGIL